jgi:hypothetical protein
VAWVLPAFFVAFAMDIGQISTSAAIRHNGLTWQRAVTFSVFSLATYYLQFLYIAHHLPLLTLASGISESHRDFVKNAVDAAIWILPLLLPLSTMLYTISDGDKRELPTASPLPEPIMSIESPAKPMLEEKITDFAELNIALIPTANFPAHCDDCGWHKDYEDSRIAKKALNTHKSIHCPAKHEQKLIEQNGNLQ